MWGWSRCRKIQQSLTVSYSQPLNCTRASAVVGGSVVRGYPFGGSGMGVGGVYGYVFEMKV